MTGYGATHATVMTGSDRARFAAAEAALQPAPGRFPGVLGVLTGMYLASVAMMSAAGEGLSWVPQVIGLTLGVGWIVIGVMFKGQPLRWSAPVLLYVLFALWCGTGLSVTINTPYFMTLFKTILKVALVTWVASQCTRTRNDFLVCCLLLCIAGFVIVATGIDTITRAIAQSSKDAGNAARASGTLINNSNNFGIFGVIVIIGAVACLMGYRNVLLKSVGVTAIACGLYIVAASGSRKAMAGVALSALALYFYHFRKAGSGGFGKKVLVTFLTLVMFAGTAYYLSRLPFLHRFTEVVTSSHQAQKEARYQYFFKALESTAQHPLIGLGIGGFSMHRLGRNASGEGQYSHSSISETLSCTGIPGFLLYYGSQFALYKLIRRVRRLRIPRSDWTMVNLIFVLYWVQLAFGAAAVIYDHRLLYPLIGAICGYLWNLQRDYADTAYATVPAR